MFSGEIRTNRLPGATTVFGLEQDIGCIVEDMRIDRRKHNRLGAIYTILLAYRDRSDVFNLASTPVETRNLIPACAVNDVMIQRVRRNIAVLDYANRMPIAK